MGCVMGGVVKFVAWYREEAEEEEEKKEEIEDRVPFAGVSKRRAISSYVDINMANHMHTQTIRRNPLVCTPFFHSKKSNNNDPHQTRICKHKLITCGGSRVDVSTPVSLHRDRMEKTKLVVKNRPAAMRGQEPSLSRLSACSD